jgi:hypothetical protein
MMMVRDLLTKSMLTATVFCSGVSTGSPFMPEAAYHPELKRAHAAYLNRDHKQVAQALKALFMMGDATQVEKRNAYDLYDKALTNDGGAADWRLPAEVTWMKVDVRRRQKQSGVDYQIKVGGRMSHEQAVQQLQLIKYPDHVLIDKEGGIGEYEEEIWEGVPEFGGKTRRTAARMEAGLYLLNLETASGLTEGWFILTPDMNASRSANLHSPEEGDTLIGPQPEVFFQAFVSEGFDPQRERWSVLTSVTKINAEDHSWQYLWSYWGDDPALTSIRLGTENEGGSDHRFVTGLYQLSLDMRERHKFGDLHIGRVSRIERLFRIGE